MIYILVIGWILNAIAGIVAIKSCLNTGEDIKFGELIGLLIVSLFPFVIAISIIFNYIDFDKVALKGKKK